MVRPSKSKLSLARAGQKQITISKKHQRRLPLVRAAKKGDIGRRLPLVRVAKRRHWRRLPLVRAAQKEALEETPIGQRSTNEILRAHY